MRAELIAAAVGLALAAAAGPARADATIVIVNTNAAGVGFNDTTPATPVGGNPGTTLGQQRLNVFLQAAQQWGRLLNSPVEIRVQASMAPQTCGAGGTVLGSAGPISLAADFPNAPRPNTAYHIAHANALAGVDLAPAGNDINTTFNVSLDSGCSPNTAGWWYGTDPTVPVPADRLALLPVVFHELGHGLGFSSQTNPGTGAFFSSSPPVWTNYLYDLETQKHWRAMTAAERVASAVNDPDLVWSGLETNRYTSRFLAGAPQVIVNAPAPIAGSYGPVQTASFGPTLPLGGLGGDLAAAEPALACDPISNPAAIAGRIALVDRGTCNFTVKVANAQQAGAIAVLVANNEPAGLPGMGGADPTVTIPSLGITQALGATLRGNLPAPGVNLTLGAPPGAPLAGTQAGCMRMFAPNPVQQGSSVSHFSADAFPNLLMEPALTGSIFDRVDLTVELFTDIGWSTNRDEVLYYGSFDPPPCAVAPLP
jgi:hypothetical protein